MFDLIWWDFLWAYWIKAQFKQSSFIMHAEEWEKTACVSLFRHCKSINKSACCVSANSLCGDLWARCTWHAKWLNASAAQDALHLPWSWYQPGFVRIAAEASATVSTRHASSPALLPLCPRFSAMMSFSGPITWPHVCLSLPVCLCCSGSLSLLPLLLSCLRNWNCLKCISCGIMEGHSICALAAAVTTLNPRPLKL